MHASLPCSRLFAIAAFAFLSLCATTSLSHSATTQTLNRETVVLEGTRSAHEVTVELHRPDMIELTLVGEFSELIDPSSSSLSIWVDDKPVRHVSFARLTTHPQAHTWTMQLTLPKLSAGFHRISTRTALHREDDPCFQLDPDGAWVHLQRIEVRSSQSAWWSEELLATFPTLWTRQPKEDPTTKRYVVLDFENIHSPEALAAYLAADALVRERGFDVALSTREEPWRGEESMGKLRVNLDPKLPHAFLSAHQDTVLVSGPDWQSVRRGLRALTTPRLLKHCDDVQCVLPDVVLDPRETASELHHDPAHVQRLEDLGLTQGWVAKGSGTHIFQTTWTRPAYWVVTHEPVYRMILHTTMNARWIDPSRSNVRISLNGIPLDQFSLESTHDAGTTRHELIARIPQSFWLEQSWTFVIEASIYTQSTEEGDEKRCSASNEHIWIRLDPATGLWVPRKEHRATGLSSFGLETPPVVVWESSRSVKQMMTLGALMYPLTLNHGELDVARDGAMCAKSSSCVFMSQDPGELPDPFSLVSHDHHTGLVDQSGIYAIPVLDVESTLVLTMQSQGLFLWFPDTLSQPVPPPDYAQLRGTQALFVKDTWIGAPASKDTGDMVNIRMPFSESADAAPRDGETQQLVQLVELLWWAVLAVSGIGAMFYFSRRVKATPMDQFDARGYENLERHKEE